MSSGSDRQRTPTGSDRQRTPTGSDRQRTPTGTSTRESWEAERNSTVRTPDTSPRATISRTLSTLAFRNTSAQQDSTRPGPSSEMETGVIRRPNSTGDASREVRPVSPVKRFTIRDIVDASSKRDIQLAKAFDQFEVPKMYEKKFYCISCAIHSRVVKVRSVEDRKNRLPPQRVLPGQRPGQERAPKA